MEQRRALNKISNKTAGTAKASLFVDLFLEAQGATCKADILDL